MTGKIWSAYIELTVVDKASKQIEKINQEVSKIREWFSKLKNTLIWLAAAFSFEKITSSLNDFEFALTQAKIAAWATEEAVKKLRKQITELSNATGASRKALADMAVNAARLWIPMSKNNEKMMMFVKTLQKIMTLEPDFAWWNADEAASRFAKLLNVLQLNTEEAENLAASMSLVTDVTAATVDDIAAMALRFGAAARNANATAGEIVWLAAALTDLWFTAEQASTPIIQFLVKLQTQSEQYIKVVEAIAPELRENFVKALKEDWIQAIKIFSEALKKLDNQTKVALLKGLKISDVNLIRVLQVLSTDKWLEKLNIALETASKNFQRTDLFTQKYEETLKSAKVQLQIVKQNLNNLIQDLAWQFIPVLVDAWKVVVDFMKTEEFKGFVNIVKTWIQWLIFILRKVWQAFLELKWFVERNAEAFTILISAVSWLVAWFVALRIISYVNTILLWLQATLIAVRNAFVLATVASINFGGALRWLTFIWLLISLFSWLRAVVVGLGVAIRWLLAIFTPIWAIITAVATAIWVLVYKFIKWYRRSKEIAEINQILKWSVSELWWIIEEKLTKRIEELTNSLKDNRSAWEKFKWIFTGENEIKEAERIGNLRLAIMRLVNDTSYMFDVVGRSRNELLKFADSTDLTKEQAKELAKVIKEVGEEYKKVVENFVNKNFDFNYSNLEQAKISLDNLKEWLKEFLSAKWLSDNQIRRVLNDVLVRLEEKVAQFNDVGKLATLYLAEWLTNVEALNKLKQAWYYVTTIQLKQFAKEAIRMGDAWKAAVYYYLMWVINRQQLEKVQNSGKEVWLALLRWFIKWNYEGAQEAINLGRKIIWKVWDALISKAEEYVEKMWTVWNLITKAFANSTIWRLWEALKQWFSKVNIAKIWKDLLKDFDAELQKTKIEPPKIDIDKLLWNLKTWSVWKVLKKKIPDAKQFANLLKEIEERENKINEIEQKTFALKTFDYLTQWWVKVLDILKLNVEQLQKLNLWFEKWQINVDWFTENWKTKLIELLKTLRDNVDELKNFGWILQNLDTATTYDLVNYFKALEDTIYQTKQLVNEFKRAFDSLWLKIKNDIQTLKAEWERIKAEIEAINKQTEYKLEILRRQEQITEKEKEISEKIEKNKKTLELELLRIIKQIKDKENEINELRGKATKSLEEERRIREEINSLLYDKKLLELDYKSNKEALEQEIAIQKKKIELIKQWKAIWNLPEEKKKLQELQTKLEKLNINYNSRKLEIENRINELKNRSVQVDKLALEIAQKELQQLLEKKKIIEETLKNGGIDEEIKKEQEKLNLLKKELELYTLIQWLKTWKVTIEEAKAKLPEFEGEQKIKLKAAIDLQQLQNRQQEIQKQTEAYSKVAEAIEQWLIKIVNWRVEKANEEAQITEKQLTNLQSMYNLLDKNYQKKLEAYSLTQQQYMLEQERLNFLQNKYEELHNFVSMIIEEEKQKKEELINIELNWINELINKRDEYSAQQEAIIKERVNWIRKVINYLNREYSAALRAAAAYRSALAAKRAYERSSSRKWFATWWFTWWGAIHEIAWVVHKWEYVIPNHVLKKLLPTWLIDLLEKMRKWFATWWFTSNVNWIVSKFVDRPVNNVKLEVHNAIQDWIDVRAMTEEMYWLLKSKLLL